MQALGTVAEPPLLLYSSNKCALIHRFRRTGRRRRRDTWLGDGGRAVGWMSAQLQRKLGRLVVSMLWQADISVDVIDVDALHCMLSLGYSTKTVLPHKEKPSDKAFLH